jgi:RNA polymerase sigma-70 factor (ECF subfamily)
MDFEKIYKLYKDRIFRFTFNYSKDRIEQEELVQDIFYNIFISLKNFKKKSLLSTYIYSIARNTCLNFIKKNIRERKKIEKMIKFVEPKYEQNPYDSVVLTENSKFFLSVLEKLPYECREIYFLSEVENLKYKDISKIKKLPIGTVKSRLNRAKKKIIGLLKEGLS